LPAASFIATVVSLPSERTRSRCNQVLPSTDAHTDVCVGTRDCSGLCCCCCNKHTALTSDNAVPRQPAPSLPPTSVLLPTPPSPFSPPHQLAPRVDTRRPMNYTPRTARRIPALRLMTSLVVSRTSVTPGSTLHDGGLRRLHSGWNERQ